MSTEYHIRLQSLIDRALDQNTTIRGPFLEQACADDTRLLADVHALLPYALTAADGPTPRIEPVNIPMPGSTAGTQTRSFALDAEEVYRPPFSLDQYRVQAILGRGGMGVVYRAVHATSRMVVAIKLLRPEALSSQSRHRFVLETEILRNLKHPGVARILFAGVGRIPRRDGRRMRIREHPYFVMEFIDGLPLTQYAESQALTLGDRLALFGQVCDAVEFAHRRGIIHRDLKPDNIMVDGMGVVKVLDFGVARLLDLDVPLFQAENGTFVGTPAYASPEQFSGQMESLNARSDVYSLTLILHELLTGRRPELVKGRLAIYPSRVQQRFALDENAREVEYLVREVLTRGLSRDPKNRYASAGALHEAVAPLMELALPSPNWIQRVWGQLQSFFSTGTESSSAAGLLRTVLRARIEMSVPVQLPRERVEPAVVSGDTTEYIVSS